MTDDLARATVVAAVIAAAASVATTVLAAYIGLRQRRTLNALNHQENLHAKACDSMRGLLNTLSMAEDAVDKLHRCPGNRADEVVDILIQRLPKIARFFDRSEATRSDPSLTQKDVEQLRSVESRTAEFILSMKLTGERDASSDSHYKDFKTSAKEFRVYAQAFLLRPH